MASKCQSCNNTISNCDFITCAGVCGEHFHIKCVSVTKPMLAAVTNCPNIHWYCHNCNDGNRNVSAVINSINESMERLSNSLSSSLLQFLDGFKILMNRFFETTGTANIAQNLPSAADLPTQDINRHTNGYQQRRVEREQLDDRGKGDKNVIVADGKCPNSPNIDLPDVTFVNRHTRNVVISNIGKGIPTDYLTNYLADELKIDKNEINVSLLLPAGKSIDDMTFLQYKVTIPEAVYTSIMDSGTWPSNVRIRDFVNKPRRNVVVSLDSFTKKRNV